MYLNFGRSHITRAKRNRIPRSSMYTEPLPSIIVHLPTVDYSPALIVSTTLEEKDHGHVYACTRFEIKKSRTDVVKKYHILYMYHSPVQTMTMTRRRSGGIRDSTCRCEGYRRSPGTWRTSRSNPGASCPRGPGLCPTWSWEAEDRGCRNRASANTMVSYLYTRKSKHTL